MTFVNSSLRHLGLWSWLDLGCQYLIMLADFKDTNTLSSWREDVRKKILPEDLDLSVWMAMLESQTVRSGGAINSHLLEESDPQHRRQPQLQVRQFLQNHQPLRSWFRFGKL